MLRRRFSGTAIGTGQDGTMSGAPVDLTGLLVMTLPKHLGDIREPHPVHCNIRTRQTWGVDSHMSERNVEAGRAIAH